METFILIVLCVYIIHLVDKWLDRRSAEKFVQKICGKSLEQ